MKRTNDKNPSWFYLILFERPNFNQENQTQMILFCLIGIYDFFTYNYIHCGPMVRTSSYTFLSWLKNALRCDDQSLVIKPQGFYTGKSWTRLAQKKTYEVTVWPKIVQIVLTLRIYNRKHKVLTQLAIQVDWIGIHHSKKNKLQKHRIELICYGRNLNN